MKSNFSDIINGDNPVLIDFYADWCQPCKMQAPILKELKSKLGDEVKIVKIDTEKNRQLALKYQVRGVDRLNCKRINFRNEYIRRNYLLLILPRPAGTPSEGRQLSATLSFTTAES